MEENTCRNCIHLDEYNFCGKLVVDTMRRKIGDEPMVVNYIGEKDIVDNRSSFIVPMHFCCIFHECK